MSLSLLVFESDKEVKEEVVDCTIDYDCTGLAQQLLQLPRQLSAVGEFNLKLTNRAID